MKDVLKSSNAAEAECDDNMKRESVRGKLQYYQEIINDIKNQKKEEGLLDADVREYEDNITKKVK